MAFAPALACAVVSVWVPMLRSTAGILLGIAMMAAAAPWFLERFGPVMFWPAVVVVSLGLAAFACALLFQWWGRRQVMSDARKRLAEIDEKIAQATTPEEMAKHMGARAALLRLTDRQVDRAFQAGSLSLSQDYSRSASGSSSCAQNERADQ